PRRSRLFQPLRFSLLPLAFLQRGARFFLFAFCLLPLTLSLLLLCLATTLRHAIPWSGAPRCDTPPCDADTPAPDDPPRSTPAACAPHPEAPRPEEEYSRSGPAPRRETMYREA